MAYLFETDEHAALRAQIRRFAEREIAPHAHAWDEARGFPRELYGKAAAVGLLGVGYPAGYLRGTVVERLFRDARLYPIGGGTREIMNEIIAKTEGY